MPRSKVAPKAAVNYRSKLVQKRRRQQRTFPKGVPYTTARNYVDHYRLPSQTQKFILPAISTTGAGQNSRGAVVDLMSLYLNEFGHHVWEACPITHELTTAAAFPISTSAASFNFNRCTHFNVSPSGVSLPHPGPGAIEAMQMYNQAVVVQCEITVSLTTKPLEASRAPEAYIVLVTHTEKSAQNPLPVPSALLSGVSGDLQYFATKQQASVLDGVKLVKVKFSSDGPMTTSATVCVDVVPFCNQQRVSLYTGDGASSITAVNYTAEDFARPFPDPVNSLGIDKRVEFTASLWFPTTALQSIEYDLNVSHKRLIRGYDANQLAEGSTTYL